MNNQAADGERLVLPVAARAHAKAGWQAVLESFFEGLAAIEK